MIIMMMIIMIIMIMMIVIVMIIVRIMEAPVIVIVNDFTDSVDLLPDVYLSK